MSKNSNWLKLPILKLFLLILVLSSYGQTQNLHSQLTEIDAYAGRVLKDQNQPGMAIAIVKDNKTVFAKGYGVRELGKPEKVDENTVFAIASNSKAFTTAALSILIDEGKIGSWDDKVIQYLPEFKLYDPYVTENVTIRDLVSHRTGLDTFSGDLLWYGTNYGSDEILRRAQYLVPHGKFRASYGYQNLMFIAAGRVIERVSGKTWGQFVSERILQPLGMNRTVTSAKDLKENAALPHNESGGKLRVLPRGNGDNSAAAGGINSSAADMAKWLLLQLGKGEYESRRIVSAKNIWEMQQPAVILPITEGASRNNPTRHFNAYALGWNVYDYQGRKIVTHSGGIDGMLSRTVLIPEENIGFVILTNGESQAHSVMFGKMLDLFTNAPSKDYNAEALEYTKNAPRYKEEENKRIDESHIANTEPSLPPSGYAGTYSSRLYGDVTVTEENGKLVMRMLPAPDFVADLEHRQYDTFEIKWRLSVAYNFPRGFVTFTIDKNGVTDQLQIDQRNTDFWFYELDLRRTK
jgi:CubicO group peptidase (beta-lactamase class C family)